MTNRLVLIAAMTAAVAGAPAHAQVPTADTILVNGKVITLGGTSSIVQAIAIHDGKVLAVGSDEDVRKRADTRTNIIDLGGRTVVPGLMDSHIHALRAGLTYSVELSWIGVPSLAKGLDLIREAARTSPPGTWIKIGGGWTELQFPEKRGPTVEELVAAAPDRPVYVQRLYNTAWITPAGIKLMKLTPDTEIPSGKAEKDASGNLTGVFTGLNRTFNFFTAKIPGPSFADQVTGTRKYFRELNRLGMTAVNDFPGGGMFPEDFRAIQTLWSKGEMTLRVAFHISSNSQHTLDDFKSLTVFTPMNFGDDMLRYRGIGESLTQGIYDGSTVGLPYNPSAKDWEEFCAVAKWAAEHGINVHQHAASDRAAAKILDCFEAVNKDIPIAGMRWQIAHIENASDQTLRRMKALNMGWAVQDRLVYSGPDRPQGAGSGGVEAGTADQNRAEHGLACGGRHRFRSGRAVQSVRFDSLAARRQGDRRHAHAGTGRVAEPRRGVTHVFAQFGMVHLRRNPAGFAGTRQICRSRRAVGRLYDGAGREGLRIACAADTGRRQGGVWRGTVHGAGGEAVARMSAATCGCDARGSPRISLRSSGLLAAMLFDRFDGSAVSDHEAGRIGDREIKRLDPDGGKHDALEARGCFDFRRDKARTRCQHHHIGAGEFVRPCGRRERWRWPPHFVPGGNQLRGDRIEARCQQPIFRNDDASDLHRYVAAVIRA